MMTAEESAARIAELEKQLEEANAKLTAYREQVCQAECQASMARHGCEPVVAQAQFAIKAKAAGG